MLSDSWEGGSERITDPLQNLLRLNLFNPELVKG